MNSTKQLAGRVTAAMDWSHHFIHMVESGNEKYDWANSDKQVGRVRQQRKALEDKLTDNCRVILLRSAAHLKRDYTAPQLKEMMVRFGRHAAETEKLEALNAKMRDHHDRENS